MTIEQFNKIQSEIPDSVLTERARELISKLCATGGAAWSLGIPPNPEKDPDMVFGELTRRVEAQAQFTPNSFLLLFDENRQRETCIVATKYENGKPSAWAIQSGNFCMSKKDGLFFLEPTPSNRDDEYFNEFRFTSPLEAKQTFDSFHNKKQ